MLSTRKRRSGKILQTPSRQTRSPYFCDEYKISKGEKHLHEGTGKGKNEYVRFQRVQTTGRGIIIVTARRGVDSKA
jgi:hypothetical protein